MALDPSPIWPQNRESYEEFSHSAEVEAVEVRLADGARTSQAQLATPEPKVVLMRNHSAHEHKHDENPTSTGGDFPVHHEGGEDIPNMDLSYQKDSTVNEEGFQDQGDENNQLIDNQVTEKPESIVPSSAKTPVPDFSFSNYNPLSVTLLRSDHAPHQVMPSLIAPRGDLAAVLTGSSAASENRRQDLLEAAAAEEASGRRPAKMFEHFLVLGGDPADPQSDLVPALAAIEKAMPKSKKKKFFGKGKGKNKRRKHLAAQDWFGTYNFATSCYFLVVIIAIGEFPGPRIHACC